MQPTFTDTRPETYSLPQRYVVWFSREIKTLWGNLLIAGRLDQKMGSNFLRNFGACSQNYTASKRHIHCR